MSRHVVVVGAGIVGLSIADALLTRGYAVTVLERETKPESGCSYGNGGIVVPSHFVPLAAPGMIGMGMRMLADRKSPFGFERLFNLEVISWIAGFMRASTKAHVDRCAPLLRDLNLASRDIYESLASEATTDVGFAKRGLLMLCRTQKGLDGEAHLADDANRLGLRTRVLNASELAAVDPNVQVDVVGGVHFEDDAHLTPAAWMRYLRERIARASGEIRDGFEVTGFRLENGRIAAVESLQGAITGDEFVLAPGAWTASLGAKLGLKLPMLAGKGYGITVGDAPERPSLPAILVEGRVAVTPMTDGVRFVGTMELGLPNSRVNSNRVQGMRNSIEQFYPRYRGRKWEATHVWSGNRPCAPDGMPYLGRPARYSNLTVAAGHAMMGMSLGPISGKLVAQLISGETPSIPLQLLSPDRYV